MPVEDIQAYREQQFVRDALTRYQHQSTDLHLIGDSIGPPKAVSFLSPGSVVGVGKSPYPAREDHVHDVSGIVTAYQNYTNAQIAAAIFDDTGTFNWGMTPAITLGTGGVNFGRWTMLATKVVLLEMSITLGTGGTWAAGNFAFTLPNSWQIDAAAPNSIISAFRAVDSSAGSATSYGQALTAASPSATFLIRSIRDINTASNTWGGSQPFGVVWAAGDSLSGHLIVRIV